MRFLRLRTRIVLLLASTTLFVQTDTLALPAFDLRASDTRNDAGGSLTVTWRKDDGLPRSAHYRILMAESEGGPFAAAAEIGTQGSLMSNEPATFGYGPETLDYHFAHIRSIPGEPAKPIRNGVAYYIRIEAVHNGRVIATEGTVSATAGGNWFDHTKLNNLILCVAFTATILGAIGLARRRDLKIRRLAGLEALDEALGRATEMGKSVLFIHGLQDMGSPSTIAAVNILGQVARRTAEFDTQLKVGNRDPIVMSVSQEVVREACIDAGRPDAFREDDVFMAAADQFSYAAALEGMMVRERPAATLMVGYFYAESLLLAETGASVGAIQIAATDAYTQLPFFVTTCDYTLMGEELYAASAYLSREPKLLGSLKGQDVGKAVFIFVILLGSLLSTAGIPFLTRAFTAF